MLGHFQVKWIKPAGHILGVMALQREYFSQIFFIILKYHEFSSENILY